MAKKRKKYARRHIYEDVMTIGQVAKICRISVPTAIKWFDNGYLEGYRIPGGGDRRVYRTSLVKFMKKYGMEFDVKGGPCRVLAVDKDPAVQKMLKRVFSDDEKFSFEAVGAPVELGIKAREFRPQVVLLDTETEGIELDQICDLILEGTQNVETKIIAVSAILNDREVENLRAAGFDGFLGKPYKPKEVAEEFQRLTDISVRRQVG